jgi:hypothetical protein
VSADDILLYRTLAAARGEGMPRPLAVSVGYSTRMVYMHLDLPEDAERWEEWWTRHEATEWTAVEDEAPYGRTRHAAVGTWRGWQIELVHLTPAGEAS